MELQFKNKNIFHHVSFLLNVNLTD